MRTALIDCRIAIAAVSAVLLAGGCGTVPMGQPQASIENIQAAKASGIAAANVARFSFAEGKDPAMDLSVGVRATTLTAPQGSFARYLQETLETELRAAGLLDPSSEALIEGTLTDRQLEPSIGQGSGRLAARIVVKRRGQVAFDREVAVDATWESSFVGAVAIPAAINEFTALFRKLVSKLLTNPDFRAAMAR